MDQFASTLSTMENAKERKSDISKLLQGSLLKKNVLMGVRVNLHRFATMLNTLTPQRNVVSSADNAPSESTLTKQLKRLKDSHAASVDGSKNTRLLTAPV